MSIYSSIKKTTVCEVLIHRIADIHTTCYLIVSIDVIIIRIDILSVYRVYQQKADPLKWLQFKLAANCCINLTALNASNEKHKRNQ